jgi:alkanesulfonate monooxygenase SsuD/methylene tetrahydromethanopterin reductase-like flavin-dependent oxidoreductase (luciferase family)
VPVSGHDQDLQVHENENDLRFGVNIDPAHDYATALANTRLAESLGLDHALIQDHAYVAGFVETWTLLAALAASTSRIELGPNVLTTPFRLPAMIAKEAATFDLISNGRLLLGLGAGANPQGIVGMGGPDLLGRGETFRAFRDALAIIRGLWASNGEPYSHEGDILSVHDVEFGPVPTRRIPIITGAMGPQSLRLTARLGDGISVSTSYVPAENLSWFRQQLDEGAELNGREPSELRIYYNVMGYIEESPGNSQPKSGRVYRGDAEWWIETLSSLVAMGVTGFTFWPTYGDVAEQFQLFAEEVVPRVRRDASRF